MIRRSALDPPVASAALVAALGLAAAPTLSGCGADEDSSPADSTAASGGTGGAEPAGGTASVGGGAGGPAVGGSGAYPPYPQPQVEGIIRGVDDTFWANMDDFIFTVVAPSNVKLYVTVMTAAHYLRPEQRALGIELVRHPESLFANAVVPFLDRYGSTGVIWAVDCLNEPEGLVAGNDGNWETWGATWDEMRAFLAYCAGAVHGHDPNLAVSAGSGWHEWVNVAAGRYDGLGFDFYDYHLYDDVPDPPHPATLGVDRPVVIGECGQESEVWDDTLQYTAVRDCFVGARDNGYLAALSWYYNHAGSDNHHTHVDANGDWRPVRQAFDDLVGSPDIALGLNLAWLSGAYRHDFGTNPLEPTWSIAYEHDVAQAVVADYEDVGIGIMRLWLFEAQEALPFHAVFDGFEGVFSGWEPAGPGVSLAATHDHAEDGTYGLALSVDATAEGWYGIRKRWPSDARLNLAPMEEWAFYVRNELGQDAGVNLAFTTDDGGPTTYQTRSGPSGGQIWLADGAEAVHVVSLGNAGFADRWALESAPSVGVARPNDAELEQVTELRIRVHLSSAAVPLQGQLYLDAVRVR
ncbi:MAG: hypothetical protein JRI23_13515 [Deltaproteobacteria bacterium]|jgi:hypothetical protein|nr:hypothetical protein [Deltaproteobacteria bacterium]MBW2532746.1 hypothetical protein [Deltaproteobacteria bacterium]